MAKFKFGDRVRVLRNNCGGNSVGDEFMVSERTGGYIEMSGGEICVYPPTGVFNLESELELVTCEEHRGGAIKNNDSIQVNKEDDTMDLLKKFADALMGEPEKSLQKYGVTDERGNLTSQGAALYQNWKFKQDLEAFQKDVLAVLIKADKKSKKDEE